MNTGQPKHEAQTPTPRSVRRACAKELYRTAKRLKQPIPAERMQAAEQLYYRKVIGRLEWIAEHRSNRKALADWWEEAVSADIAELWGVEPARLTRAFRDAFGA